MKGKVFFITGIDTNIGKTYATALLANNFAAQGKRVITQKMIQTGCIDISEDIEKHRELQQLPLLPEDKAGTTCPYLFTYPCSPHLAAEIDGVTIDCNVITQATEQLQADYEIVLLEGAGGLMVPIDDTQTTIDYVKACGYPIYLVTSAKLGSINHTLLSLYACKQYEIPVQGVIFNQNDSIDHLLSESTVEYLQAYLRNNHPASEWIELPVM